MQQQKQAPGQPPTTSQQPAQPRRRLLVTLVLVLAIGAVLWILISVGFITSAWLAALPWVALGVLILVIVWAIFWLLNDFGTFRSPWITHIRKLMRWDAWQVILLLALIFFLITTCIEVISTLSKIQGNWWELGNLAALIENAIVPGLGFFLTFFSVYLIYRPPRQATPPSQPQTDYVNAPTTQTQLPNYPINMSSPDPVPPSSAPSQSTPVTLPPVPPTPTRSLITFPSLPTEPGTIQQREKIVQDIYSKLTRSNTTAIVLTGIGGAGKSTLAALAYRHEEKQRASGQSPFAADPLWLTIGPTVTITELASTLTDALGKPVPGIESFPPEQQAIALFNALATTDAPRLVVFDQFETLLNPYSGRVLPERPGISELLEALNSHPASCRVLLTSRLWPQGTREYAPACMREFPVERLSMTEGVAMLREQGVSSKQATDTELQEVVERCQGHPLSLTLLAGILRGNRSLNLRALLHDSFYKGLWQGKIAGGLLDYVYKQQLNEIQRKLLRSFAVYREAVPLQAVQSLVDESSQVVLDASEVLRAQHLLQDSGELRYSLHAIVADYARSHFDEGNEQANRLALQAAHARAAEYYLQVAQACPTREKRRGVKDVQPLIETIWQLCQAGKQKDALDLMNREDIFDDVSRWGRNVMLLELCLLFLPVEAWHPERRDEALAYSRIGYVYNALGQKQEALRYYLEALAIYREVGDRGGEGAEFNELGAVYDDLGQKQEALRYYQEALAIWREVGDRRVEGDTLNNLGEAYRALGQQQEALRYFEDALAISREVGDRRGEGVTLNNLGLVYNALGQQQEALRYFEDALTIRREVGDRGGEGVTFTNIGTIYLEQSSPNTALAFFLLARDIFEQVQSPNRDVVQRWIDDLRDKVGEQQFAQLLAQVQARAAEIVEQALHNGLG